VLEGFANAGRIPERRRLLFTFAMLAVYRAVVHIPTPGIDGAALGEFFAQMQDVFGWVNLLSGGALEQFSIAALGIMPTSAPDHPAAHDRRHPAPRAPVQGGRARAAQDHAVHRYGTVVLAIVQGLFISIGLESCRHRRCGGGLSAGLELPR
jgi:preprotein translocase subunit SecY